MKIVLLALVLSVGQVFAASGFKYLKGNVSVNGQKATKSTKLKSGDKIKVGDKSLAIVYMDKKVLIKIDKNSELVLEDIQAEQKETKVILSIGSMFSKVLIKSKNKKSIFSVKAANAVMGVRGTEFFVAMDKNQNQKDVWMCVEEGIVGVSTKSSKKTTDVKAGEGVLIEKGSKVTPPKKYAWTKKLNWNFDESKGKLENKILDVLYQDLLDQDYD